MNVNDPTQFGSAGGRVNIRDATRITTTKGLRTFLSWSDEAFKIKGGVANDEINRCSRASDGSGAWQAAVCGNNPTAWRPSPIGAPGCAGNSTHGTNSGLSLAIGKGDITGQADPVPKQGSLIRGSALVSCLSPGSAGFITVD